VIVVDGFLSAGGLRAVREYALGATVWFDDKQFGGEGKEGYLGAYCSSGFNADVIMQVEEELRRRFPTAIGDSELKDLWAYKYASSGEGIDVHADASAVNLNIWLTPDAANNDPDTGGLLIWPKMPPKEWTFVMYNGGEFDTTQRKFLAGIDPDEVLHIPYRQNRLVMFNGQPVAAPRNT